MSNIHWKVARTQQELDDAQMLRYKCLIEEGKMGEGQAPLLLREVSPLDNLGTVAHVLVYLDGTPIGTARLARANPELARSQGSEFGFEIERHVDLGPLRSVVSELGEVSRLCLLQARPPSAAVYLYEGLYVISRFFGLKYWVGGVDCQTPELERARQMRRALESRGLVEPDFELAARGARAEPRAEQEGAAAAAHEDEARLDGERAALRVSGPLEAFTRRLGALCVGQPFRHPTFPRYVLPMVVDLDRMPESTLAMFEPSLRDYFKGVPARLVPAGERKLPSARSRRVRGDQGLYLSLLDIARTSVERLDRHPTGGPLVRGTIGRAQYESYLSQVVHQVRDSAPMLAQAGRSLERRGRTTLAALFRRKSGEEDGHDVWALQDIGALQGKNGPVVTIEGSCPAVGAYGAWLGFVASELPGAVLGLAFVLEWFGYARAGVAAERLVTQGRIPRIEHAVRFLKGHGDADQWHIRELAEGLDEITDPQEVEATLLTAQLTANVYFGMLDWAGRSGITQRVAGELSEGAA